MSTYRILVGDCRETLRTLDAESVQCVVTSPPYFGLRDYGADGQIGLEPTPDEYVAEMVAVFREVRRVLRPDGTLWLNLGDSYASTTGVKTSHPQQSRNGKGVCGQRDLHPSASRSNISAYKDFAGLKPKDLIGIPWRVAFALQADGWYLRSDIIWSKPNPMPESVTDRPTKAHEYLFLLTKSERYFYDAAAIAEDIAESTRRIHSSANVRPYGSGADWKQYNVGNGHSGLTNGNLRDGTRNARSVWTIATQPYPGAHFATFPPELAERCILAGTSQKGACAECGAPWVRVVEAVGPSSWEARKAAGHKTTGYHAEDGAIASHAAYRKELRPTDIKHQGGLGWVAPKQTTGWEPSCGCNADVLPCVVLDPFGGSGTTGMVATGHGRNAILCELNPEYVHLIRERCGLMFEAA